MPFTQAGTASSQYQEHVGLINHTRCLGGICRILLDSSSVPAFGTSLYCRLMTSKSRLCGGSEQASFVSPLPGIPVLCCCMRSVTRTDFAFVLVVFNGRALPVPVSPSGLEAEVALVCL